MPNQPNFRKSMGLKQEDLAAYLSVSVSHLAMSEIHQRPLPSAAQMKLAELQLHFVKASGRPKKISLSAQERMQLLTLAQAEELKAVRITRKLEKMRQLHNQCLIAQQAFTNMLRDLSQQENKDNKAGRLWLQMKLDDAKKKAAISGAHAQALLELKAAVAAYHAAQARAKANA